MMRGGCRVVMAVFRLLLGGMVGCAALSAPVLACTVALDPGHSRDRLGATSARGAGEWFFNRALTETVAATLTAQGVTAVVINPGGGPIGLKDRTRQAAAAGADLFLSIHHDSVQPQYLTPWQVEGRERAYSDRFAGFGVFVSGRNIAFAASRTVGEGLADALMAAGLRPSLHHAEPIAGENRPLLDARRGLYRYDDLVVLHSAPMPAVLLEAAVIVNRAEEQTATTPEFRQRVAGAVTQAVTAFCQRQ